MDDAHGFGVIGERAPTSCATTASRATASCATRAWTTTTSCWSSGFSKAYSSLLAFLALPTRLKDALKVLAPPYLYSGPSPVASLATTLAGLEVNRTRGDAIRVRPVAQDPAGPGRARTRSASTRRTSPGFPIIEIPLAHHEDIDEVGRYLFDHGVYATLAAYPLGPQERGRASGSR